MTSRVRMRQAVADDILAHALEEVPNECCGLLIGTADEIVAVVRARNVRLSPTAYLVEPEDHFEALRRARRAGLAVTGVYHSHPADEPVPSRRDTAEALYPDFLYVIVGPLSGSKGPAETRAFRFLEAGPTEVTLVRMP